MEGERVEGERGTEVRLGEYELVTLIGRGCFEAATVHLARHRGSGELVAVKKIALEECRLSLEAVHHELLMHRVLRHPQLLESLGVAVQGDELCAAFPLMAYGSCRDLLAAHFRSGLPRDATLAVLRDSARGLSYLHARGLVHRALTASHVLVCARRGAVIAGFHHVIALPGGRGSGGEGSIGGGVQSVGRRGGHTLHEFPPQSPGAHYTAASLHVAAPELLAQNRAGYDSRVDIYSLGVLGCELATGTAPYSNLPPTHVLLCKLLGPGVMSELEDGALDDAPGLYALLEACVQQDPALRPSAHTLLQHAVFRSLHTAPPLSQLLHPVSPLTSLDLDALIAQQQNEHALDRVTKAVAEADLESNDEWTF